MSLESAREFWERMKSDKTFRDQFEGASQKDDRLAILKEAGYYFRESDLQQVLKAESGALNDEQLDEVSGGGNAADPHQWNPGGGKTPCGW